MKTADDIVSEKGTEIFSVDCRTPLRNALALMVSKNVGSVVVTKDLEPVGIWTSRDLMRNVLANGFDPETRPIEDYVVRRIHSAPHTDTAYELMDKFLGLRVNHLLIEKEGRFVGMLSTGDVMKATITEKTKELRKLNTMVSWQYYEEWKWNPKS